MVKKFYKQICDICFREKISEKEEHIHKIGGGVFVYRIVIYCITDDIVIDVEKDLCKECICDLKKKIERFCGKKLERVVKGKVYDGKIN